MASEEAEVVKPPSPPPPAVEEPKTEKVADPEAPPPPETKAPPPETEAPPAKKYIPLADVVLRVLLFAASLVAVVVMGTSKQTELLPVPVPPFRAPFEAEFNQSPALIYFIAAFSVLGFYSIITALLSAFTILKPNSITKLISHFVIFDVLVLGIAASATGAAGAVGYVGYKGQSHAGWKEICGTFDVFCKHIAGSLGLALFGSVVSTLLVILSIHSLSKKIPK